MRRKLANGFTLLEMLTVIAIFMILASLILAALNVGRNRSTVLRARRDIAQLKTAWEAYYADYNGFPVIGGDSLEDGQIVSGRDVVQILRGRENHNGQNPKKIPYMDFHRNTTRFADPWGNLYRIELDGLDGAYDGRITARGETLRQSVAVWSLGPDGEEGTKDDVLSWRTAQ